MSFRSSDLDSPESVSRISTSVPSSPPTIGDSGDNMDPDSARHEAVLAEEKKARDQNIREDVKRKRAKAKAKKELTAKELKEKAEELDALIGNTDAFIKILTKKTRMLNKIGRDHENKSLKTDENLELLEQPKIMTGGRMRDYQLEGLSWMAEVCEQSLSGILADEMGLGKTIQIISLVAYIREQGCFGPHLILAPLSTLSNWQNEFQKWTPSVPFIMYHGIPQERKEMFTNKIMKHYKYVPEYKKHSPTKRFPVVCTSYEMLLQDHIALSKINWQFIIVDEGHRLKNSEAKLFKILHQFESSTRFLVTGTPLQNNLKELWSLLNFLLPNIFVDWESFESWFDFSDLQDEEGTEEFIRDQKNQEVVLKIHRVLQPLLLRRIKADVAEYLPKKREYILYAPMTKQQTDLYNVITDRKTDTRAYLKNTAVEHLRRRTDSLTDSRRTSRQNSRASIATTPCSKNAFSMLMSGNKGVSRSKRKIATNTETPESKSRKSSHQSTPLTAKRGRGRLPKTRKSYKVHSDSDDDALDDDDFEEMLVQEQLAAASLEDSDGFAQDEGEAISALAEKQTKGKKLGNPFVQLRMVCNSPHIFYNPWDYDNEDTSVDETIVNHSGKMLLLDRLLPELFKRGHKVLIFSQFKTQLDLLHDYCNKYRQWPVCRIDGAVSQPERRAQIETFNKDPEVKIFLLSTRAGGQGINLASADTVILFDSDWNPQVDLQAQDRCHRIGQTKPVVVYRLATKGTVEEDLLLNADAKRRLEKLVIQKGGYKNLAQKLHQSEVLDKDLLKSLLLKDGQVFKHSGVDQIFTDAELDVLIDRSDAAYERAAKGTGNAASFQVIDTAHHGITQITEETARKSAEKST